MKDLKTDLENDIKRLEMSYKYKIISFSEFCNAHFNTTEYYAKKNIYL